MSAARVLPAADAMSAAFAARAGEPEPNPGSVEARALGCTCAVIDNHYGRGYRGQECVFVFTVGCPVHKALTGAPDDR